MTHLCTTNASVHANNNALYTPPENNKARINDVDITGGDIACDLKKTNSTLDKTVLD